MNSSVVAGTFTIIGVILGITGTLFVQFELRKEKFKEIIYKEKLVAYEELLDCLWKLQASVMNFRFMKDAGLATVIDEQTEFQKVMKQADEFSNCLAGRGIIISQSVGAKSQKLWFQCMKELQLDRQSLDDWEPSEKFSIIKEKHETVVHAIREELEIPRIEKSISKMFHNNLEAVYSIIKNAMRKIFTRTANTKTDNKRKKNG